MKPIRTEAHSPAATAFRFPLALNSTVISGCFCIRNNTVGDFFFFSSFSFTLKAPALS